ncbi:hypothetical protein HHI36_011454 [Cryptolaemus montrouzieri]|uniref:HTH psq-type domain-containing protein n=1 Tax=Cryptolaemus montrouzieri TaxID=559131 RepID=A0ABD2MLT3_9CUCU
MVRNYIKKKENYVNEEDAERAVLCVLNDSMKLMTTSAIYNIKPTALYYRVKKYKENFGAYIPHNINDNITEAEDVELNEPTRAVAHNATDNVQIVAPAPSAIDIDVTDAEDIEVDQHVTVST